MILGFQTKDKEGGVRMCVLRNIFEFGLFECGASSNDNDDLRKPRLTELQCFQKEWASEGPESSISDKEVVLLHCCWCVFHLCCTSYYLCFFLKNVLCWTCRLKAYITPNTGLVVLIKHWKCLYTDVTNQTRWAFVIYTVDSKCGAFSHFSVRSGAGMRRDVHVCGTWMRNRQSKFLWLLYT